MVYTEFVSCDALTRHVTKTKEKLKISGEERPVAVQLYGKEVIPMVEAAQLCETAQLCESANQLMSVCITEGNHKNAQQLNIAVPDVIDINFGCPVKKIANKGAGAGMLQNIPLMLEITQAIVKAVKIPVTVKTRLGWDNDSRIIVELAERLQDCGVAALTIHGRTRAQMYSGEADWTLIGSVKNNPRMTIPIIGNGDIATPEGCKKAFDRYGVDGVMVGRGSIGRPWIFREIKHYLQTGEKLLAEDFSWYLNILKKQILQSVERLDERRGIIHIRRHLAVTPLFKCIPDFRPTRVAMLRAATVSELFDIMDQTWIASQVRNNDI